MKVLITGSTGFVGSHLFQYLLSKNYDVVGISRGIIKPILEYPVNICDIRSKTQLIELKDNHPDFDVVIHCAAMVKRRYPDSPFNEYNKTNVEGTKNIREAFPDARLIYISSCGVKDPGRHPYFQTKLDGEHVLNQSPKNPNWLIGRLTNVFGFGKDGGFLNIWKQQSELQKPLTVHVDQYRDFISVYDVCRALELLSIKGKEMQKYIIGSGTPTSILDVASVFKEEYPNYLELEQESTIPLKIVGENEPLRRLGWTPQDSFEDFVRKLIRSWKSD